MTKQEILEKHCPIMNSPYLDEQGRDFKDRIISAMEDYAESQKSAIPCVIDQRELLIKYEAWRSTQNVLWDEDSDNVDEFLDQ